MVYGIKVAENAQRSEDRTENQKGKIFLLERKALTAPYENDGGEDRRDKIPEKTLLYGGQIAGKFDEETHQREKECGSDDQNDSFILLFHTDNNLLS